MRRLVLGFAALAGALGVAVALCEASAHRVAPGVSLVTQDGTVDGVSTARLVGRWRRDTDGIGLIVTAKGDVWSDSGAMQGRAQRRRGADFAFGTPAFFCAYSLTFKPGDAVDWHLVDHTPATSCPNGLFTRAAAL